MSFRELKKLKVLHAVLDKRFTQKAAAARLDLSERQVRRLVKSVGEFGDGGIVHRGRGRPSNRSFPDRIKADVLKLYEKKYADFGPTLASEKLLELNGQRSSSEPPPRPVMMMSMSSRLLKYAIPAAIVFSAPSPCTAAG